ncbi:MAG: septum formation initiator family protein [Microscillaceae bacterium]|nr:septum formation initiator family protein [Microscillaceae bacterium]
MNLKLPPILRNFYLLTGLGFLLWIFFLDSNDLITQYNRQERLKNLQKTKVFYEKRIKEIQADRQELSRNLQIFEKFARERHYFKKPKEDVFVIELDEKTEKKP